MSEGSADQLVLASGSASRRDMLSAAGLSFTVNPADVDEAAIRDMFLAGDQPATKADFADIAQVLAIAKAETISRQMPERVVIGADQVLAMEGRIFDKPADMGAARERLLLMRGKTHQLHAAVAIAMDGVQCWSTTDTAHMKVRDYTPGFVGRYLAKTGDKVLTSVGAYQLEGLGVQLFEEIRGDFFTILGLPLLPLLEELRRRGIIDR